MTKIIGINSQASKAALSSDNHLIVINTGASIDVESISPLGAVTAALSSDGWSDPDENTEYPAVWTELAEAATKSLSIDAKEESSEPDRVFRVPSAVAKEAEFGLRCATEFQRGGSTLGEKIARELSDDRRVTLKRAHRIFSYLDSRSDHPTEFAGWEPGQQNYPSDERIRFALWGGSPALNWLAKVVEKNPLTAAAPVVPVQNEDEVDGSQPHQYEDDPDAPGTCLYCGRAADDPMHTVQSAEFAFDYDPECEYYGRVDDADSTLVDGLYVLYPDDTWAKREEQDWAASPEPDDFLILLDEASVGRVIDAFDNSDEENPTIDLIGLEPEEDGIFFAAESELDFELIERVMDVYDSNERSVNSKKQMRGPGGRFGDGPDNTAPEAEQPVKARLATPLPVVADVNGLIDGYLASVKEQRGEGAPAAEDDELAVSAQEAEGQVQTSDVRPLYIAVVDKVDPNAVLDVVALVPPEAGTEGDVSAWKRDNGSWLAADDILASLRGSTPPPIVELDDANLEDVLAQVDEATQDSKPEEATSEFDMLEFATDPESAKGREKLAKKGQALPDGSFPIPDVSHLKKAIQAYGRAKNKAEARRHIVKRARALNRRDLIPDDWKESAAGAGLEMWGTYGEVLPVTAAGGVEVTPSDAKNAERLRQYWTTGEGGAKIRWNTPGDWTRCHKHLFKYLGQRSAGYCANLHHRATGVWPGDKRNVGKKSV